MSAVEKSNVVQLSPTRMKSAEYERIIYVATVPVGTTKQEMEKCCLAAAARALDEDPLAAPHRQYRQIQDQRAIGLPAKAQITDIYGRLRRGRDRRMSLGRRRVHGASLSVARPGTRVAAPWPASVA